MPKTKRTHPAEGSYGADLRLLRANTGTSITIKISPDIHRELLLRAEARGLTKSSYGRFLIEEGIQRNPVIPEDYLEG